MKLLIRTVVTFAITSLALVLFAHRLPGVTIDGWQSGVLIVLIVGLLNSLGRPLVLGLAVNLGLLPFALLAFLLNVVIVLLAARIVPGFSVDGLWSAFVLSFFLAVVNTICTGMLSSDDDDTFYRSVIRRIGRRTSVGPTPAAPGTVIVQIDGLAEPILRRELATDRLPTITQMVSSGTHQLVPWNCGVPSMTPGSQAGILHGNNANIPAFRWYERDLRRLVVANHPKDARWIDQRQATGHGLLERHGSSISNIFSGGAERQVITQSGLTDDNGKLTVAPSDFYSFLVSPYSLYRVLLGMIRELGLEYWQAWRQRRKNIEPRMHRGGAYPFLRAATNVLMADATTYMIIDDMFRGRPVIYADYLGYDEIAHHAGPATSDALRSLRTVDHKIHSLQLAATHAPRPYKFVVLSDHGQSTGATFRQRYGYTLAELVRRLTSANDAGEGGVSPDQTKSVAMAGGQGEGWSHLNIVLTEMVRAGGFIGNIVRRLVPHRRDEDEDAVNLGPDAKAEEESRESDVVVCASGNLALIYFTDSAKRLTLEELNQRFPRLLGGLVSHPGIGFSLVTSDEHGPLVLGASGARYLDSGRLDGDDPLAHFDTSTADYLRRLNAFSNVPDIVVNSPCDPESSEVSAYEELIGCHGGAGGLQNHPFLIYPSEWTADAPGISGPEALHAFLREHSASAEQPELFPADPALDQASMPQNPGSIG